MRKPVWRVNTGQGVPSDFKEDIVLHCGIMFQCGNDDRIKSMITNPINWEFDEPFNLSVAAYQTNRTKAAKCERGKCYLCEGAGDLETPENVFAYIYSVFEKDKKCPCCNGKGYTLERIK